MLTCLTDQPIERWADHIASYFPAVEIRRVRKTRWLILGHKFTIDFVGPAEPRREFVRAIKRWASDSGHPTIGS